MKELLKGLGDPGLLVQRKILLLHLSQREDLGGQRRIQDLTEQGWYWRLVGIIELQG